MNRRAQQIASILHQAVQSVLQEGLSDPRARGMATVTNVRVTDDLTQAVVSVSILPEHAESKFMHALHDAANYIRRQAAERVSVHHPPRLVFKLDKSLKRQAAVLAALADVASGPHAPTSDHPAPTPHEPPIEEPSP
jgi:ribosome-binding factor A